MNNLQQCCLRNNTFAEKHGCPLKNLLSSEKLPPPPPDSKATPQLLKSSPQSNIFSAPFFCWGTG